MIVSHVVLKRMKSDGRVVTKDLIAQHGLTDEEYKKILGRESNLTELGVFSVMWSEAIFYNNSSVYL